MKKQDCRLGMVVYDRWSDVKGVVVKINPKNARVRLLQGMAGGRGGPGTLWNMPYRLLDPVVSENISTEMTMRSFEQPENEGIKKYFDSKGKAAPLNFPKNSPEWHIMKAICELWKKLDEDSLEGEAKEGKEVVIVDGITTITKTQANKRPATLVRELRGHYSSLINRLFSIIGREVEKDEAEAWESGTKRTQVAS